MDPAARARLDRWMQSLITNAERLLDQPQPPHSLGGSAVTSFEMSAHDLVVPGDPVELAATLAAQNAIVVSIGSQWGAMRRAIADAHAEGEHVLWLVLGTLTWSDRKQQSHTSPLVLWPVTLEGDRLIAAPDRLPRINDALVERLRAEYGIAFDNAGCAGVRSTPEEGVRRSIDNAGCAGVRSTPEEGVRRSIDNLSGVDLDIANVLDVAAAVAAEHPEWTVGRCAWLGVYSLAARDIWHDITTRSDEVSAPLAWLLGLEQPPALPERTPGPSMYVPLDADASQLAAIRAAADGGSFVLQGAPGTGKSYTVANLAAYCVSQGRSILIVSDREAALKVIAGKLGEVGLADACAFAGEAVPQPTRRSRSFTGPTTTEAQLTESVDALDGYAKALHGGSSLGLSIYQVLARLIELRTTPNAALADPDAVLLDRAIYDRRRAAVAELAAAAREVEPIAVHPWRASTLSTWAWDDAPQADGDVGPRSSMMRGRAAQALETAGETTAALMAAVGEVAQLVPGILTRTPDELHALGDLAALAAASPRPGAELFSTIRGHIDDIGEKIALIRVRGGGEIDVPRDPASYMAIAARHRALVAEIADQLTEEGADDLDAAELWHQLKKWSPSVGPLRFVALRSARAQIRAAALPFQMWSDDAMLSVLEAIIAERACRDALDQAAEPAQRWFGELADNARNLDLDALQAAVAWAADLRRAFERVAVDDGDAGRQTAWRALIAQVVAPTTNAGVFSRLADAVARWVPAMSELAIATGIVTTDGAGVLGAASDHLEALRVHIDVLQQAVDRLVDWTRYNRARHQALDAGIVAAVRAIECGDLDAVDLAPAWERATLLEWLGPALAQFPHLAQFDGARHHGVVARFADLDRGETAIWRGRLSSRAACVLATPDAVARCNLPMFDLVVVDNAARLPIAHALSALARGGAAVVVGDSAQPRLANGSDSVFDAALAAGLPELRLSTHYRSQHHDLIGFANRRYYGGDVYVLPAACDSSELGVQWKLIDGASDETGANRAEALAIVDDIVSRMAQGQRSFAVVVLSEAQRQVVEALLTSAELGDAATAADGVLVGTPDRLDGEERDVVYLSIGYDAPSLRRLADHSMERWFGVATTRARRQLVVMSSFAPDAIAGDESHIARTVADLLEFARSREPSSSDDRPTSDAISDAIGRALVERGWKVKHRIAKGSGEVALAVLDPDDPRRCVLAIEHDGAGYAASPSARDRDRLREQHLVRLGWRVHRVWSLDWWANPEREILRAHAAIVTAIAAGRQRGPVAGATAPVKRRAAGTTPPAVTVEAIAPEPMVVEAAVALGSGPTAPEGSGMVPVRLPRGAIAIGPYTAAAIPCGRRLPEDMFAGRHCGELAKVVEQVLAAEAPIHVELLSRRTAAYFGVGRINARITDQVRTVLEGRGHFGDEPDIVWRADQDPTAIPPVRVAGANAVACRDITEIPLAEVAAAARIVVERASGLAESELVRDCARLLGFARLSDAIADRVARGVQLAAGRELISIDNGRAHLMT